MDKQQLKEMFADGKRPTGADFSALIDALWEDAEVVQSATMKTLRVKWARSISPMDIMPGEYWYNPSTGKLVYMGEYRAEEVSLKDDVVYIIEDDMEMFPGQYVYRGGMMILVGGGGGGGVETGVYIGSVEEIG